SLVLPGPVGDLGNGCRHAVYWARLAAHTTTLVPRLAHDVIDGDLVLGLAADRLKRMAGGGEIPVPLDTRGIEEFSHLLTDRIVLDLLVPAAALGGEERQAGVLGRLRLGSLGQGFAEGLDRLRPQGAAPRDAGLRAVVVHPAAVQVERGQG